MNRVLLFGSTGNLGKAVAAELVRQGSALTAVARNEARAAAVSAIVSDVVVANATNPSSRKGICEGVDAVVSALGKSVSPNDKSRPSFRDADLSANPSILGEAVKSGVKKFVYVPVLHSENYPHLDYFRARHAFSER